MALGLRNTDKTRDRHLGQPPINGWGECTENVDCP